MRHEAVQPNSEAESCFRNLMNAEYKMKELRNATIVQTKNMSNCRVATTGDVHQQLILLVEWAKVCINWYNES